jgi:hypothetical protein
MIFNTDVLIWALRGNERAARAIDAAPDRALAIISLMDLLQGARSSWKCAKSSSRFANCNSESYRFLKPSALQPLPWSNSTLSPTVFK